MAAGTYWSPLLGGLLSTPKAGFGRKKRHLLYWKTSSYLISWKRNVWVQMSLRDDYHTSRCPPQKPSHQLPHHTEGTQKEGSRWSFRKQICEPSVCLLPDHAYTGNSSHTYLLKRWDSCFREDWGRNWPTRLLLPGVCKYNIRYPASAQRLVYTDLKEQIEHTMSLDTLILVPWHQGKH